MRLPKSAFLALLVCAASAGAISMPKRFNFQGKLVDPATNAPRNGTYSMTFRVYRTATGGTALYTEAQSVSVINGAFSVQIGSVTPVNEDLFAGTSAYLGITVSPDSEMTPRQLLAAAPYAFTAKQLAQDGDILINPGFASSTFTAAGNLLLSAGVKASSGSFTAGVTASTLTLTGADLSVGGSSFTIAGGSATLAYRLTAGSFAGNGTSLTGTGGYTIAVQALTATPADGQTVYWGMQPAAPTTTAGQRKVYIRRAGTIRLANLYCYAGTAGSNENWSMYVRLNNTTDTLIQTLGANTSERIWTNSALSIAVAAGDYFEIKGVQPTFGTNPATNICGGYVFIE